MYVFFTYTLSLESVGWCGTCFIFPRVQSLFKLLPLQYGDEKFLELPRCLNNTHEQ